MQAYIRFVSEDPSAPVAVRVVRPYATEEELLDRELDTLSRTTVGLIGAPPKPQGVVLRFEVLLSTGAILLRGEGRAIGYREDAHDGQGELTLRFTRLDTRSKAFVDRATAMRDARRPIAASGSRPSIPPPSGRPTAPPGVVDSVPPVPSAPPSRETSSSCAQQPLETLFVPTARAQEREPALARLRERAKAASVTFVRRDGQ